jgi:hypothetical protein
MAAMPFTQEIEAESEQEASCRFRLGDFVGRAELENGGYYIDPTDEDHMLWTRFISIAEIDDEVELQKT